MALVLAACTLACLAPPAARAALRSPQVPISGTGLQSWMSSVLEYGDVRTTQDATQYLAATVSSNTTFSFQLELAKGGPIAGSMGLYDAAAAAPAGVEMLPPGAVMGWFAVASFRFSPVRVVVSVFDENASFRGSTTYLGGNRNAIGLYLDEPGVRFYSQDIRNPAGEAQMLFFAGTGASTGGWWVAAEDAPRGSGADSDFDDVVIFVEPFGCPCPVQECSWGALKVRFR